MEDGIRDKAESKLARLEREADEIRAFLRVYDELSDGTNPAQPADDAAVEEPIVEASSRDEIIAASRDVLRDHYPNPVKIGVIYDLITAQGIKIRGKQPKGNLSAKLSQPADLVYVKDEGWYYRPTENEGGAPPSEAKVGNAASIPDFLRLQPSPEKAHE